MTRKNQKNLAVFEEKAQELVSMTLALCEKRIAEETHPPLPPQKALAAAALSVQASVNTFLAVTATTDEQRA